MGALTLKAVTKVIQDKTIIQEINLNVEPGEMIVVVGPSGCGKSTLLRMIAGLETVTSGEIYIHDKCVNNIEPKNRNIAMVFQNYALYPHMTVYNNMAYGLKMRGYSKDKIAKRVAKAAALLGLEDLLDRKPHQLSGGQRQRVAMGRAIVRKPDIFLFDEPLSNLDAERRVKTRLQIKKLQQQMGITSVYVTHDQVEAMTLADRIVVLRAGEVEQIGEPLAIYHKPANMFVAGFMGSPAMNFIPGVISNDGLSVKVTSSLSLAFSDQSYGAYKNRKVMIGIRPEHIFAKEKLGADWFDLNIDLIETLGTDTLVYGTIPGTKIKLTARLSSKWQGKMGDTVTLAVMPSSILLFDEESERLIEADRILEPRT